jgi:signal transduction histidine kinase
MRSRARSITARAAAPVGAAVLVSAVLVCLRLLGAAAAVTNSPAGPPLLGIPFLLAYVLGYETGVSTGLFCLMLVIAGLWVANGPFSVVGVMITVGPWVGGRIVRSRRQLADQLRARNEQLAAQQEAYAAEAVRYERSRIAADLHDMVGHALSLMVIQASAGQRAATARRTALETVAEAARQAQADIGLLAGLLSEPLSPGGLSPAGLSPAGLSPGGLQLAGALVRQVRAAGVDVTYRVVGCDGDVDTAAAEVVSRIVAEALTNALKHAPGAPVTVDIEATGSGLTVTVDNGAAVSPGPDIPRGGNGLTGMRERVLAHGGQFDAGPTAAGGWRVRAVVSAS